MSAGTVFLGVYMLIGAVLSCVSLWLGRRHPDRPGSRALSGASTQEAAAGFILACLAWPWVIYMIRKRGNDQP